jgi:diaminopimelate decarboxylase
MELQNGRYTIQGIDVEKIAQQFGSPVYVYDENKMIEQINKLKSSFSTVKLNLHYAVKALSNINILKVMKKQGLGLDTVSIEEVYLGMKVGFSASEILYTPNCVSFYEIKEAVDLGVKINIDNISILEQFGNEYGSTVPCCIRLNPHIMAGGNSKIQVGHIDSKFGISILQMRHVLRVVNAHNIHVNGLHMHTGSDILDADVFLRAAEILFDCAKDFKQLDFIDFGSGFKVAYKNGDVTTDIETLGKKLSNAFREFCKEYGKELELWFEPGKYIVSEAGYFLVTANVIKQTPATVFVGVNSGLNHLIRPMLYDAYHEIVNVSNTSGASRIYTVVGYICETDTFGWDRKLNDVKEGDILCMKNAGAYGFTMASNYNSRFRPAEVLISQNQAHLIRKRESLDDILHNQIEINL